MPRSSKAFSQIRSAGNSTLKYESTLFPMRNRKKDRRCVEWKQVNTPCGVRGKRKQPCPFSSPVQPPSDLWSGHSPPSHSSQDQFGNQQPVRRSQPKLTVWSESMKWILCFYTDNKRIPATNCKKHQDTDYTGVQHLSWNIKSREWKIIWEYFSNFRLGKVCFHRKANPEAVTNKISRFAFIKMGKPSMTPS